MIKEAVKRFLKVEIFLTIFTIIPTLIFFLYQNGLFFPIGPHGTIAITIAILLIYTLLFAVIVQHIKLTEKQTAADKLREDLQKCENPNLKIETIKQTTHIKGPNVIVKRGFIGMNYSNKDASYLVVQAGGDKALTLKKLHFKVYDAKQNCLKVKPFKFRDRGASDFKILKIEFKDSLTPKEEFNITMEHCWPGAIDPKGDYVMFTVSPYKFVDNAKFEVIFDAKSKPKVYTFFTTDTCQEIKCTPEIGKHDELKLKYYLKCIGTENYKFTFGICENEGVCKNKRHIRDAIRDALKKSFYPFNRFYDNSRMAE